MANRRKDKTGKVLRKGEMQRANNSYMYRWTGSDGKRECIYAPTLMELREMEEVIEKERIMGISRKGYTLNEQIERYLKTKRGLADSTEENYKYYLEHVIRDSVIGGAKITDIKKSDLLLFYNSLIERGLSVGTVKIIHKIIHPAFQLACDDNIISKNPSDDCMKDYSDNVEKKYALTRKEEQEFFDRIMLKPRMRRYYPMYAIMIKTGLRISETVGLTWNDVDMWNKMIHINHQVQYRKVQGGMKLYVSETKTDAGKRSIPMTDEVYRLFLEQKKVWMQTKKDPDFEVDGYRDFVFLSHMTGKCMYHSNIRRMMKNIVDMNNEREIHLPDISPHILRHTACSRFAEAGCDIKVLQYVMGQTDIKTTMQIYNHADLERVKRTFDKLEKADIYGDKPMSELTPKFTPFACKFM